MNTRYIALVLVLLTCGGGFVAAQRCSFRATNIDFGNYTGSTIRVTGTLTVNCPLGALYAVGLDAGRSGGTVLNRNMTDIGNDALGYALYSNPSYTTNWGDTAGTGWVIGIGTGNDQVLTVYGQVPPNQFPAPEQGRVYRDIVTATLSGPAINSETARLTITANVLDNCSLAATDMVFGAYSGSLINIPSTILVTCTNRTNYNVGLNAGTATGATVTNRSMTGPGGTLLGYKLFSDSGRTVNWGNTVGTNTVAGTGTGAVQILFVYGQLPANQNAPPGSYSDTITVTVTF